MPSCSFCSEETNNRLASSPCCETCADTHFECERCGGVYHTSNEYGVGDERWCGGCADDYASPCSSCYELTRATSMVRVRGYGTICESCRGSGRFFECNSCGYNFHNDSMSEDYETCNDCYCDPGEDDCDYFHLIHSFDYKPRPVFFGKGPHFGVELEVNTENISDDAKAVVDELGDHVYLKNDGSIGRGFEIVTHPHSLAEHTELWNRWSPPSGMTSYQSGQCGIHVHIARSGLTHLQIGKMLVFLNDEKNQPFMAVIAQRTSRQWAKVSKKKISDVCRYPADRYQALNLCNHSTIEVRIFRGNTRKERILKAVEFCAAMRFWVKTASCQSLTSASFIKFVSEDKRTYPNLWAYMIEKNLATPVKGREVKKVEDQ